MAKNTSSKGKQTILPFVSPSKDANSNPSPVENANEDQEANVMTDIPLAQTQSEVSEQEDENLEVCLDQSDKDKARDMLREHIKRSKNMSEPSKNQDTEDGYKSDDTNAASNKTSLWNKVFTRKDPKVKNVFYYKAKLTVPQNDNFYPALREVLKTFIDTIQEVDKEAKIMKFKDRTNRAFLSKSDELPESPSKIKEFFSCKYRAKKEESYVWPEIRIGFNTDQDEFLADAKILLKDKGDFSIFLKDIQAEEIETVGYFLFSTQAHDKNRLIRAIKQSAFEQYKENITLALRWKKIGDPKASRTYVKYEYDPNKPEEPKAFHVETIKGHGEHVARVIGNIYSRSQKEYPDGEKLRFIPLSKYLQNQNEDEVHAKVLNRQRWFLSGTSRATSFEIQDIDTNHASIGKSFRQIVLEYKAEDGEALFISIDQSYDGGISFLFPNVYETQARSAIADFGPFLRHKFGDMILVKHFTPEAAARASESEWDDEKKCSVSGLEKNLNAYVDECDEISWLKQEEVASKTTHKVSVTNVPAKPSLNLPLPNDDSSLPTFTNRSTASNGSQKRSRTDENDSRAKKRIVQINEDVSDMDTGTLHTLDTLQSRMDSIESTLASMNAFFQAFDRQQNSSTTGVHVQPRPYTASDPPRNDSNPASALTDKGKGR